MIETTSIKEQKQATRQPVEQYERFHWTQRIAHAFLLTSFTLLGLTGLPQKFATAGWAEAMIHFFGGIETTRLIHHICAIVLMILAIYHLIDAGYKIYVLRTRLTMLPGIKDAIDAIQAFGYNLGILKKRPQMGRFTFDEKAEYWALIWGTVIMGITGFIMWNPITTTRFLPGEIIPASKAAHGGEAILAVMAIIVWHMYGVHIKRFNKAMFTGKQTEEEMLHEHPLELADIKAGIADRAVAPADLRRRKAIYFPVAGVLSIAMLIGVYGFSLGEKTAITTVLPISNPIPIYVPQTPTPIPTEIASAVPADKLTWVGSIGILFQSKCVMCHNPGLPTNGLSLATYADAMKGASDGAVLLPGDANNSRLMVTQSAGGHPGQLTSEELATVRNWIIAGALEK
jgi:cytochrome b subunit of formate dehydrogenase/cytochrome c551/c552